MDIKVSLRDALRSEFCPSFSFFAEYKDFSFIAVSPELGAATGDGMSIVMRPTQLFTAVYLTKNLFAAEKWIYFFYL